MRSKLFAYLLASSMIWSSVGSTIAHAQSVVDLEPPIIELEESPDGIAGQTQVFTALVADDQALKDVKLYYRYEGQQPFASIVMTPLASTGYYTANVPTVPDETRAIEYYLQARDLGGNRVVRGYAFDPLVRRLSAATPVEDPVISTQPATGTTPAIEPLEPPVASTGSDSGEGVNWVTIGLGVLAVGVLAGLAGGSSGSGGGDDGRVPLTINISAP